MSDKIFTTGSGNIFVDLGFSEEESAELTMRSCLLDVLQEVLRSELETHNQDEVAKMLGVDQPIISKILNDKMAGFSVETITTHLTRLHYDIYINAQPTPAERKIGRVIATASRRRHERR